MRKLIQPKPIVAILSATLLVSSVAFAKGTKIDPDFQGQFVFFTTFNDI